MNESDFPSPSDGFVLTYTLIVEDVKKSCDWYKKILNGKVVMQPTEDGAPCILKVANTWIIINFGGGDSTEDKPKVTVGVKKDNDYLSHFLNIRVANISKFYKDSVEKGAEFLTTPKDFSREIRCYLKDPDGYLIEVGQAKL